MTMQQHQRRLVNLWSSIYVTRGASIYSVFESLALLTWSRQAQGTAKNYVIVSSWHFDLCLRLFTNLSHYSTRLLYSQFLQHGHAKLYMKPIGASILNPLVPCYSTRAATYENELCRLNLNLFLISYSYFQSINKKFYCLRWVHNTSGSNKHSPNLVTCCISYDLQKLPSTFTFYKVQSCSV